MFFNLNKLDNSNNIGDGSPGNTLFMYHVTAYEDSTLMGEASLETSPKNQHDSRHDKLR